MRYITADYIFSISRDPVKNGIIAIDDQGFIADFIDPSGGEPDESIAKQLEYYKGIICPGFINTHCHLELSYLKGKIREKTGFADFAKQLMMIRGQFSTEEMEAAIIRADKEMFDNGIVAVGDISNTAISFALKKKSNIYYHTFIELIGLNPLTAEAAYKQGLELQENLAGQPSSLSPHAPYSVSKKLRQLIRNWITENDQLLSIHMQESQAEEAFFIYKTGPIQKLYEDLNINIDFFQPSYLNALQTILPDIPKGHKTLFVHNTFTSRIDIQKAHAYSNQIYWCFCPNANRYIENTLPDFQLFIAEKAKITIGTDSLASNHQLSVLEELKTISFQDPHIPLNTLLTWATKNGAAFLGLEQTLGSIEKGKKPGLALISAVNDCKLQPESSIRLLQSSSGKIQP